MKAQIPSSSSDTSLELAPQKPAKPQTSRGRLAAHKKKKSSMTELTPRPGLTLASLSVDARLSAKFAKHVEGTSEG